MAAKFNIGAVYKDGKKTKCKWKGCKPNTHPYPITYIKGGVVKRAKYTGTWAHPSAFYSQKSSLLYYVGWGKPEDMNHITMQYKYKTQNHHVIPCNVMEGLKNIPHNLELLGWDMNNGDLNGMCLPTYNADIAWHDLQLHRGPHYQYDNKVKAALKNLETECQKYCKDEAQELLLGKITSKVTLFKLKIKNWQVTLNASSPGLRQSIFNPSSAT